MLRSRIVPCLLLSGEGLVKTERFKTRKYVGDPLNAVKIFNEKEVDELTFLDIDATAMRREPNYAMLRTIAIESRMPLTYGGGVASVAQAERIISLGFEKVSISAAALARPELIAEMAGAIGSQSVVVTVDAKRDVLRFGYSVYSHNGSVKHDVKLFEFCRQAVSLGAGEIVVNSIERDGIMSGYDLDLARRVRAAVDTPVSFVGGAGNVEHMQALIDAVGVVGAAAGSMFVFRGQFKAVLISYARPGRLS